MKKNWLITGVPRGGTTLLACLITSLENAYCFSEPAFITEALNQSATQEEFLCRIRRCFAEQRETILATGRAVNRIGKEGHPVTNYFRRVGGGVVETDCVEAEEAVPVRDERFTLAIKQNAEFLSVLPLLCEAEDFQILAILRHPVPTILSWRSLALPISRGRLPVGEKFWRLLAEIARCDDDVLTKQARVYEAIASRLLSHRHRLHLLCYENLVREPGIISRLLGQRFSRPVELESRNRNPHYLWDDMEKVRSALIQYAPVTCKLYPDLADSDSCMQCLGSA